jgi:hypothetical protein
MGGSVLSGGGAVFSVGDSVGCARIGGVCTGVCSGNPIPIMGMARRSSVKIVRYRNMAFIDNTTHLVYNYFDHEKGR